MRSSVRNVLWGALAAVMVFAGNVPAADAQARVDFDAATTVAAAPSANLYTPTVRADFRAQQAPAQPAPQLGPAPRDGGIGIGAEIMAAFPNFTDAPDLDAKTSWGVGLWVGGNRNGIVGFTGEFIYLFKEESANGVTAKRQALEIPAVFHINIGSRQTNGPMGYLVLGPVFTISVKNELTGGLTGDNFSDVTSGVLFGAGFEVARIAIEGRYNYGLSKITSENGGVFEDAKEHAFELLGKVRFN